MRRLILEEDFNMNSVSLVQICQYLKDVGIRFEIYANMEVNISGFSSFNNYKNNTLTWIKNIEKYQKMRNMENEIFPALIIIDKEVDRISDFSNRLVCDNPKFTFSLILREFFEEKAAAGFGKGNIISENATLQQDVSIGCNCVIEDDVIIGSGTRIYHNVIIRKGTVIGKNCVIKSGTVIGEEGYGYSRNENNIIHVSHFGHVVIEDEVEIGSNCSIDRGTMDDTVIGRKSKVDNLCHIAHNVRIGKHVMIVAGSIICGSAHIKDGAYIAPGAIIKNQIEIAEKCIIGMGSVVLDNTQQEKVLAGIPARNLRSVGKEDL